MSAWDYTACIPFDRDYPAGFSQLVERGAIRVMILIGS